MSKDDDSGADKDALSKKREFGKARANGKKEKGKTNPESGGGSGDYGVIRPSAAAETSGGTGSENKD